MFSIRTTYSDSICYCPDGAMPDRIVPPFRLGNPDSHARSMSFGRGVPTPCTQTLPLAQHSSVHPGKNSVRRHFHIQNLVRRHFTSGYVTSGWERRMFQLLRSDISESSGSAYPVRHAQLQWSPEASWYFRPTFWDILGYFALDIWCLNSQSLLVIHQW